MDTQKPPLESRRRLLELLEQLGKAERKRSRGAHLPTRCFEFEQQQLLAEIAKLSPEKGERVERRVFARYRARRAEADEPSPIMFAANQLRWLAHLLVLLYCA